jgi:hypothetical protein
MDNNITYLFQLSSGTEVRFDVALNRPPASGELPDWTLLERDQCPHCPLRAGSGARCPAAADLAHVVPKFAHLASFENVLVRVIHARFEAHKRTDAQTALSALMGLILATSGCPILNRMRPLAHMHLPFATQTELVYRLASMHVFGCFLDGVKADLADLRKLFDDIDKLNRAFATRIKRAIQRDANINALVMLHSRGMMVSLSMEENLKRIREWFRRDAGAPSE